MNKKKGFILPVILVFLSFITVWIALSLTTSAIQYYLGRNEYQQFMYSEIAQTALLKVPSLLEMHPHCEQRIHGTEWFLRQTENWWQSNATCKVAKNIAWVYIPLAIAPCDKLKGYPVKYYEIVMHASRKNTVNLAAIIASPLNTSLHCAGKQSQLQYTIQSKWRL